MKLFDGYMKTQDYCTKSSVHIVFTYMYVLCICIHICIWSDIFLDCAILYLKRYFKVNYAYSCEKTNKNE